MIKSWEKLIIKVYTNLLNQFKEMHDSIEFIEKFGMKCASSVPLSLEKHVNKLIENNKEQTDEYEIRVKCLKHLLQIGQEKDYHRYTLGDDETKLKAIKEFCNCWTIL